MDSFYSEPITTDSSTSEGNSVPQTHKKVHTRKTRRTEDLISVNISEPLQKDSNQTIPRKRQNNSFLPKIDLEDGGGHAVIKTSTFKQNRPSLAKKTAIFKIGRSLIEGKQFQRHKNPSKNKLKFPKINLKPTNKDNKKVLKMGQGNSSKLRKSDELVQVPSVAAGELFSESALKEENAAKRKSKSMSPRSGQENNNEAPQVSPGKSKFLKINLKLTDEENSQRKQLRKSDELMQVLSSAAEEFRSETTIKVGAAKRKSESLSRKSGQGNNDALQISPSKSKFPKIILKLTDTDNEEEHKMVQGNSKTKLRESDELGQVLSFAAQELLSESAIKVKRKSKSFSRKSGQRNNNETPRVVFKDLYVNLVPLEKTNLLNEDQLKQLKIVGNITSPLPLGDANFNKRNSSSSRRKTFVGKENWCKPETPKDSILSARQTAVSVDKIKESHHRERVFCLKNIVPCKVILERLTLEQIQLLTLPKESNKSLMVDLPEENNVPQEIVETNQENINADELANQNTSIDTVEISSSDSDTSVINLSVSGHSNNSQKRIKSAEKRRKSSLSKFRERSNQTIGNCEESLFIPGDSSSPLIPLQVCVVLMNDCSNTPSLSSSTKKRLTYELVENNTKLVHSESLISDTELENDIPYEVEAGSLTRRSSKIGESSEELLLETNIEPSTSTNKSKRKSRRSKNETYELNKGTNDVSIQEPSESFKNGNGKDATFEIDISNRSKAHKSIQSAKHSNSYEHELTRSGQVLMESGRRSRSCDLEAGVRKKRKSNSCDPMRADLSVSLLENKRQSEEQQNTSLQGIPKKRRSTITLEDSINDIALLKSVCDSSGTPRKLNKSGKAKSQTFIRQVLDNKSMSGYLDYSNITTRKHSSSYSESIRESSNKRKSRHESVVGLESISPPWSNKSNSSDDSIEVIETDNSKIFPNSLVETSKSIRNDKKESSEEEVEEDLVEETETPSSSTTIESSNTNSLSKQVQKTARHRDIIEVSDEEENEEESSTSSGNSDSLSEKQLSKQGRRVTFETNSLRKEKQKLSEVPFVRVSTSKPTIKSNTSNTTVPKNRRVTFSDMSVIIVDDSSISDSSLDGKCSGALVPTNFLSDDDESSEELPQFNKRGTVGHTPIQKRVESSNVNKESTPAHIQSPPRFSSRRMPSRSPIQLQSHINSPQFNKRGAVGRTPLRLKMPVEDNNTVRASAKFNKRISSRERVRLQNDSLASPIANKSITNTASKINKMPNFASMHKKMFAKMLNLEEHLKRKDERAKLLLSGHKPPTVGSSLKKSANKQSENNSYKKISSKKQLKYEEPSTSGTAGLPNKREVHKTAQLVSSTPKGKKNEKSGYTRYGFKVMDDRSITKKEQLMAVANKTRPPKSNTVDNRTEIRGVRSNRRFDLLMKMRQKQQK